MSRNIRTILSIAVGALLLSALTGCTALGAEPAAATPAPLHFTVVTPRCSPWRTTTSTPP